MDQISNQSLFCPNCGACLPEESKDYNSDLEVTSGSSINDEEVNMMKTCSFCGSLTEKQEIKREKVMPCPRCKQLLTSVNINSTIIKECSNCGGIWLENDVFQKIRDENEHLDIDLDNHIKAVPAAANTSSIPERMYIPCPECDELMIRKNFAFCSGVIVDYCKMHGTWFDNNELQQIISFIKSGGLLEARKTEIQKLDAEQKRLNDLLSEQKFSQLGVTRNMSVPYFGYEALFLRVLASIGRLFFPY